MDNPFPRVYIKIILDCTSLYHKSISLWNPIYIHTNTYIPTFISTYIPTFIHIVSPSNNFRYNPLTKETKAQCNLKSFIQMTNTGVSVRGKQSRVSHQPYFKNKTPNFKSSRMSSSERFSKFNFDPQISGKRNLKNLSKKGRGKKGHLSLKKKIKMELER